MEQYLHAMTRCAVASFRSGRQEDLPEDQRLAAGYMPVEIKALAAAGPAPDADAGAPPPPPLDAPSSEEVISIF